MTNGIFRALKPLLDVPTQKQTDITQPDVSGSVAFVPMMPIPQRLSQIFFIMEPPHLEKGRPYETHQVLTLPFCWAREAKK
jgi:hypothetical protein